MKKILLAAALGLASFGAIAQGFFDLGSSRGGQNTYIRIAPTYVDARVLAATVSETHTLPSTARLVLFAADCNFYAKAGASAAVPAADVTDGTAAELNPAAWDVTGLTQITLIAATACKVTLSIYK